MFTRSGWRIGAMALGAALLGCGSAEEPKRPALHPVKGAVLFEGQPSAGAVVIFHPLDKADAKAPRSYGRTDAGGTFTLSTHAQGDGAPVGRYVVTVVRQDGEEGASLLPERYASPQTSDLRAEIKEGPNELPPFRLRM